MNIPRLPFPQERLWKLWLPLAHYAAGFYLLAFAIYTHTIYVIVYHFPADFSAYYNAAHIGLTNPANLYNDAFYSNEFRGQTVVIPYLYPPTFLLVLWPFAFLSYSTAYYIWVGLDLVASFVLYKNIRELCEQLHIEKYKQLLASMTVGIAVWGYVLLIGQTSIIMAMALSSFFLSWQKGQHKKAAFWLAVALCIKPHFFIPLLFFMAGCKHYRFLGYCLLWLAIFVGLSLPIVGYQVYSDFLIRLTAQHTQINEYVSNFKGMINIRGIFTSWFPGDGSEIARAALVLYGCINIVCFFLGRFSTRSLSIPTLFPLVLTLSWLFSPWLHIQDCYCLFPIAVLMFSHLLAAHKAHWLLPSYLLIAGFTLCAPVFTPYILGKDPVWFYRISLILLTAIAVTFYGPQMARKPDSSA